MIEPVEFLTIYCCFEDVDAVSRMLPTVLAESKREGAAVVVHDCSVDNRPAMEALLQNLKREYSFFLLQTDPISMGLSRNLAMWLALEVYAPTYICMIEDDHGYGEGLIPEMINAMKRFYGKEAPSKLRYGMFTACPFCWGEEYLGALVQVDNGKHSVVDASRVSPLMAGGANSCFRCAPTTHWISVLRGYDVDEYPISTYQTAGLNYRNYHKGFTAMAVCNGELILRQEREGRGFTTVAESRPFNEQYAARDSRSGFNLGAPSVKADNSDQLTREQRHLRELQNRDYSYLDLLASTERSVAQVKEHAESIYGEQWNFYSNALRREVVNAFEVCAKKLGGREKLNYLEVGSCQGLSMSIIGAILRAQGQLGELVSVDPYFEGGYVEGAHGVWQKDLPLAINKVTRDNALRLYAKLGLQVELVEHISDEGLKKLSSDNRKFDLIYIDGSHEGMSPLKDVAYALGLIKENGIIILDDHLWPDVKVVKKLCDRHFTKVAECWKVAAYRVTGAC